MRFQYLDIVPKVLLLLVAWLGVQRVLTAAEWHIALGPVEFEVSERAVEGVLWKDIFLFGDPHSNVRPVMYPVLLTDDWKRIADPRGGVSKLIFEERSSHNVRFTLSGEMVETEGSGRWDWREEIEATALGKMRVRYSCRTIVESTRPVRQHRLVFCMNRHEVLRVEKGKEITTKTPGRPFEIVSADGVRTARGFGEVPNIYKKPREIAMPFQGAHVRLICLKGIEILELWNGGWGQRANLFVALPTPEANAEFQIDLAELVPLECTFRVEEVPPTSKPWLTMTTPPRPKPERPLRLAQCTPAINQWHRSDLPNPSETEKYVKEMVKHFDVVELFIAWADWRYAEGWDKNEKASADADALAAKAQEWINIGHTNGLMMALSLSFGDSEPGTSGREASRLPQFQAEIFDPNTGEFKKEERSFDWANAGALDYARRAWFDTGKKIKNLDFLFYNEPHYRLKKWYKAPFYSQTALDDFRRFTNDPKARFPAKPYAKPSSRTDNNASQADWLRWKDWIANVYARRLKVQTEAMREANRDNPNYKGAIWFQNVEWIGPDWGTDLDRICATPEIEYIVCEYCTSAQSEHWKKFKFFAHKYGKKLSSFVNIGYYDPHAKGRLRFEGTNDSFARAVRMGVDEHADMIALYHASAFYPWHDAYNPQRARIWREITKPYCLKQ